MVANGLRIPARTPDGTYVEMVEIRVILISSDASFIRSSSRSAEPHPLFKAFVGASYAHGQERKSVRTRRGECFAAGENGTKVITAETQKSAEKTVFTSLRMTSLVGFSQRSRRLCGKRLDLIFPIDNVAWAREICS